MFLPGGADIDPVVVRRRAPLRLRRSDRERDRVELALDAWAIEDEKPVLGVCRGMQLINLAAGGTLYQDLAEQMPGSIKHDYFPFGGEYTRDISRTTCASSPTPGSTGSRRPAEFSGEQHAPPGRSSA